MAEEVVQKLGLDATQAIQALRTLGSAFAQYARNVQAAAAANAAFNKNGRDFLSALATDAKTVAQFTKDLAALTRAQDQQAAAAARAAAAEAKAAAQRQQQGRATKIQKSLGGELTAGLSGDKLNEANQLVAKIAQIGAKANLSAQQIRILGRNLDKAFVGPQGQITKILRELNDLSGAPDPGPKLKTGFLSAVVAANLLSNAISGVKSAMLTGVKDAIEYEKTLARIQTIAGADSGNLDLLSDKVRALADEFGQPAIEVAAAQYDLLSNQIGNASTSTDVLREALKLANVTGASVPDTVNAISSVLNSYNLSTSQAADVSAKLFKAVDLGRFTLDEIANSLGRVTVVGSQVGVSVDEILASLSTLTITGIKADEAMTLLGNAIRGLLKPTDATQGAMQQLGVQTAEAGIKAFGFLGFLEKITEVAGDSASEITQLTENIRVARGFLGLTGQQADRAAENLKKLQNTTAETLDIKNQLIIQTNAKQVEKELQQIKNFFVVDLGRGALQTIAEISSVFGGLANVVKALTGVLAAAGGAFAVIKIQSALAAAGITSFNAAAAAAGPSLLAFGVAAGTFAALLLPVAALAAAVHSLGNEFADAKKQIDSTTDAANKLIDIEAKQASLVAKEVGNVRREQHQKRMSEIAQFTAALGRANNFDRADAFRTTKSITTFFQSQLKDRIAAYEKYVDALAKANSDHEKNTKESTDRITQLQDAVNNNRFNRRVDQLPEIQAQAARLSQVQTLLNRAQDAEAQGPAGQKRADQLRDEAAALAEQVASTAQQSQNRAQLKQAEDAIDRVLRQQVESERQRQLLGAATAKQAQAQLAKEQVNLAEVKDLESRIREIQSKALTDKDLTNEQRVELLRKAVPLAEELRKKLASAGDPNLAKNLGLGNLTDEIRKPLIDALGQPTNVKLQFEGAADQLARELNSADIRVKVTPIFQAINAAGLDIQKVLNQGGDPVRALESQQAKLDEQVTTGIKAAEELASKQAEAEKAVNTTTGAVSKLRQEMVALAKGVDTDANIALRALQNLSSNVAGPGALAAVGAPTERFQQVAQQTGDLERRVAEALQKIKTDVNSADVAGLIDELNRKAAEALKRGDNNLAQAFNQVAEGIQNAAEKQRELLGAQGQIQVGNAASSQLETLRRATQLLNEATTPAKAASDGLNTAIDQTGTKATTSATGIDKETQALIRNTQAKRENAAAGAAQGKAKGGLITYRANGGMVYLANGGAVDASTFKPRGTDTVPAMLSPGEFVINAASTRKFYSQLVAMNAGRQPVYRAEGGPVTNVSIGDVNVNSQGGNGTVIGRDVARSLNREIRRGNIRLKR